MADKADTVENGKAEPSRAVKPSRGGEMPAPPMQKPPVKTRSSLSTLIILWGVFLLIFFFSSSEMKNPNRVKGVNLRSAVLFDAEGNGHMLAEFSPAPMILCIWKPGNPQNEDWLLLALSIYPEWKQAGWEWLLVPLDKKSEQIKKPGLPFPQYYDPLGVLVPRLNPFFLPACYQLDENGTVVEMLPQQISAWRDLWKKM